MRNEQQNVLGGTEKEYYFEKNYKKTLEKSESFDVGAEKKQKTTYKE